jgi:hypothetical protein
MAPRPEEKQIAAQIVIAYIEHCRDVGTLFTESAMKGQPQIEELWSRVIQAVSKD